MLRVDGLGVAALDKRKLVAGGRFVSVMLYVRAGHRRDVVRQKGERVRVELDALDAENDKATLAEPSGADQAHKR